MTTQNVRVGLILPNRGPVMGATTIDELLDLAVDAERSGWDSVWVGDSLLAKPRVEAVVTLSAIAARTERVRLGAACMASTPLRNPLLLAYQWASLDQLSGGRTVYVACQGGGPGSGGFTEEFDAFGVEPGTRMARLEEALDIMRATWTGDEVSYAGTHTAFTGVTVLPRPVQQPLPIWLAANPDLRKPKNVASAYRRVARYADGWQTTHSTPEEVSRSLAIIGEYADELGRPLPPSFEVSVCSNICVAADEETAYTEAKRFLDAHSIADYSREFLDKWVAKGTPEQCVDTLAAYVEAGATTVLLRISSFEQRRQFEWVTAEVLPELRARSRVLQT